MPEKSTQYLDQFEDKIMETLSPSLDELWIEIVSPNPLPWQLESDIREHFLDLLIQIVKLIVPARRRV